MVSFYPGQKANAIAKAAKEKYDNALIWLKTDEELTNKSAAEYGEVQLRAIQNTIGRFIRFIESTGRQASESEKQLLDSIEFSVQEIQEYKAAVIGAEQFFGGGAKAALGAAAGYGGAVTVATSIGVASTGTAISSLSGAAATNAMLAWFGGGAVAAGGGGMAVGVWVLGGITAIPALGIGAFLAAREGAKALTKAKEYEAEANKAIADIHAASKYSRKVQQRIAELRQVFEALDARAIAALDELEANSFDSKKDAEKFQQVGKLIKSLVDFLKTPVLNAEGKLNLGTVTILEKYRPLLGQ